MWLILYCRHKGIASYPGSCHQEPGYEASAGAFHRMIDIHVHKKLVCVYNHKLKAKQRQAKAVHLSIVY